LELESYYVAVSIPKPTPHPLPQRLYSAAIYLSWLDFCGRIAGLQLICSASAISGNSS